MRVSAIVLSVYFCLVPLASEAAAIHDAAKKGDVAAISAALDAGANVNESDAVAPPLYYAVSGAHLEAAKLLNIFMDLRSPRLEYSWKSAVCPTRPNV